MSWKSRDVPAAADAPADSRADATRITAVRVLSSVAILLILFVIFAPQDRPDAGPSYSSFATGPGGARALYEVLGRVGFAVARNEKPLTSAPDSTATYVLLSPAQPLTQLERDHLLRAIRSGATFVFTPGDGDPLVDSLGFEPAPPPPGFNILSQTTVAGGNPRPPEKPDPVAIFQRAYPISVAVAAKAGFHSQPFLWLDAPVPDSAHDSAAVAAASVDSTRHPALVLGHRFGRGYVIAIAPAEIVTNQLMHEPHAAIAIVRAIQFATAGLTSAPRSNRVVFDEYHHGFGTHANMVAAVEHGLTATPPGRVTLELIAAALVLLLAYGVRPLPPVPVPHLSRRSPLEHVGALAHAYLQVDARKLGTSRLVHGLRRRHSLGLPASLPDTVYLAAMTIRVPGVTSDVDRILTALAADSHGSSHHFASTNAAIANIERTFKRD